MLYTKDQTIKLCTFSHENHTITLTTCCFYVRPLPQFNKQFALKLTPKCGAKCLFLFVAYNISRDFDFQIYQSGFDGLKNPVFWFFQLNSLKEVRPTQFLGVPRVWEKIHESMKEVSANAPWHKRLLVDWARSAASEHFRKAREKSQLQESLKYKLAKKIVLR